MEGRWGGKGDKVKPRRSRGRNRGRGKYQGRGNCGTCPFFNMHLHARIPLKTKPPSRPEGLATESRIPVFGGTGRKWGTDRKLGTGTEETELRGLWTIPTPF